MAVITSKNVAKNIGQREPLPEEYDIKDINKAQAEPKPTKVQAVFLKIKTMCGPTSEIARLCDKGVELSK